MRLLLVMPTGLQVGYDEYFSSSPLGIETLAAHARPLADVALMDLRGHGHDVEVHADQVVAHGAEMIGLSVNSAPHTKYALALAAAIRRRDPNVKIIVGGQQATFIADEMTAPGHIQAIIRGEGELTLTEIMQRGGDWRGVAGVSWRRDGVLINEPDRPLIQNIDDVLPPARELLADRSRYRMGKYRVEGIETSRGCAHQCSFCSIRNFHRGKWRPKSVARVMQEVDSILERYPEEKVIYFADDNFSTDMRRVEAICRAIADRKSDAYFWCQARADQLARNPQVVEWMGKAKFSACLVGLETANPRLLKNARKGTSVEQITETIRLLHAQDIGIWGTFTLGLPGETLEDTVESAKFIPKAKVDVIQITVATPIPGSDLYNDAKAKGDILDTDWDRFDFTTPLIKGQGSKAQMESIMHKAYLKAYLSPRFLLSLFSQRTNLSRLRRTVFGVFWSWIAFIIKQRLRSLVGLKVRSPDAGGRVIEATKVRAEVASPTPAKDSATL